jgi:hypothetical protein
MEPPEVDDPVRMIIMFLLFLIILQDNRFVRNLFKRSKVLEKVASPLAGLGTGHLAGAEPSQVATRSFNFIW